MRYAGFCVILLLAFSSVAGAQGSKQMATTMGNQAFAQLTDQFVKDSLALSPVNASYAGLHQYKDPKTGKMIELDAELDDVSARQAADVEKFYRGWRARFQKETPVASLNAQDAADYRLIDDNIALILLEYEHIQSYKHQPQVYVELVGNALFLPLTQEYASKEVRVGHVVARIGQIPRLLDQAKSVLTDADPIFITTAVEENEGNINLVDSVAADIPAGSPLKAQYEKVAPAAKKSLAEFTAWMQNDLAKRPTNGRDWRLGKEWYAQKFHYVMETSITPDLLLADAEAELKRLRTEMMQVALPMYKQMYPGQDDYSNLPARERENKIIRAVIDKISDEHPRRDQLVEAARADVEGLKQFIREKKIVSLGSRDNLKVIPTPEFMRAS